MMTTDTHEWAAKEHRALLMPMPVEAPAPVAPVTRQLDFIVFRLVADYTKHGIVLSDSRLVRDEQGAPDTPSLTEFVAAGFDHNPLHSYSNADAYRDALVARSSAVELEDVDFEPEI